MNKKDIPVRKLYNLEEKPSVEFRAFFSGPSLYATPRLWMAYKKWKQARMRDEFALFAQEYTQNPAKAQKEINDLPNPFLNATKGQPYTVEFFIPESIYRFKLLNMESTGLNWSFEPKSRKCLVSGIPAASGEYKIKFAGIWHTWQRGQPLIIKSFSFIINPNPADLWQNIPSDQTEEYARPDAEYNAIQCDHSHMWGASLRGRSHAHKGLPRDDAFALGCIDGWQILTVADGAGSAPYSRKGADIACKTVIKACSEKLKEAHELNDLLNSYIDEPPSADWLKSVRKAAYNILPNAAFEAGKAIRAWAQAKERLPRDYATTLLICLVKHFPAGWAVLSFQIGDGAMAAITGQAIKILAKPDEGEYGGQTRFITMPEVFEPHELMNRLNVQIIPDLLGAIIMTDGVSDAKFPSSEDLESPQLWKQLWQELQEMSKDNEKDILEWLNFWSRGNHDDRTITWLITADCYGKKY